MADSNILKKDFYSFTGVVEDRNDPQYLGRYRVRVLGIHTDDKKVLPTKDLPWAQCILPVTSPGISGLGHSPSFLVEGSWVFGYMRDGASCQEPVIIGSIPGHPIEYAVPSKGFYDPNGIYPGAIYEPDTNRLAVNKKVVIGWTGTQGTRVYLEGLIPTLEKLHHLCPFKLMVVSNFEMSHPFLDLEVVKWSSEKEIKQLHNFDIGIYPLTLSDWVGGKSGLKALQYMAVGIPPVSSAVGNVVNFINNNEDGILINNEEEWLINLESLIKDQEKRENIGKKAREKFLREFSQDKIFDQYFSLITIKK